MPRGTTSYMYTPAYVLYQGFPTEINLGLHTCQSGHKMGRMEQKIKEFVDFLRNFDH